MSLNDWVFKNLPSKSNEFDPSSDLFGTRTSGPTPVYCCKLCYPDYHIGRKKMESHCQESRHYDQVEIYIRAQTSIQRKLFACWKSYYPLKDRIKRLGMPAWRNDVQLHMIQYDKIEPYPHQSDYQVPPGVSIVDALISKYELMEKISLLELAAWKSACIMEKSHLSYYEMLEWIRIGWINKKQELRHSPTVAVIVRCVLPFLQQSSPPPPRFASRQV